MLHKISGILSGTPTWVFFVFAYLVFIGIKATKDRIMHVGKIFLMPSIFFALFLTRLIAIGRLDVCMIFSIAMFISLAFSYFFLKREPLKIEKSHVFVKGSYETLIVVMIIFIIKYYFGYMKAVNGELEKYLIAEIIISGITSGFLVNKAIHYARLICVK
jgi:membrane protein CcdC involved in cytochrome C biogenesis